MTAKAGARQLDFTPGWSVGWYFLPIANLWKPYQAMKEIWRASARPDKVDDAEVPGWLPLWWFLWLAFSITSKPCLHGNLRTLRRVGTSAIADAAF